MHDPYKLTLPITDTDRLAATSEGADVPRVAKHDRRDLLQKKTDVTSGTLQQIRVAKELDMLIPGLHSPGTSAYKHAIKLLQTNGPNGKHGHIDFLGCDVKSSGITEDVISVMCHYNIPVNVNLQDDVAYIQVLHDLRNTNAWIVGWEFGWKIRPKGLEKRPAYTAMNYFFPIKESRSPQELFDLFNARYPDV